MICYKGPQRHGPLLLCGALNRFVSKAVGRLQR